MSEIAREVREDKYSSEVRSSKTKSRACLHIQCTTEKEHNFSFLFLDVLVKRNSCNGSTTTTHSLLYNTVYRKPTHTNRYFHYTSHHPKYQKLIVAKTLLSRVNTHITDKTQKHSELQNIRSAKQKHCCSQRVSYKNHFSNF